MDALYSIEKVLQVARDHEKEKEHERLIESQRIATNAKSKENIQPMFDWETLLAKKKLLQHKKLETKQGRSWRETSTILRSKKVNKAEHHRRPLSRSQTSKSSVSLLLNNDDNKFGDDKPWQISLSSTRTPVTPVRASDTAKRQPSGRTESDSFVSNEAYYMHQTQKLGQTQNARVSTAAKPKINKTASMSVLEQAHNWSKTLRHDQHSLSEYNAHKASRNMLFDVNNNSRTSKNKLKRLHKTQTKIKALPVEERQWLKVQSDHWRSRRGYVSSTTAPVGKDDFHRLFTAFRIASKHKKRNNEAFISDKDIKNIALRLGVHCSDRDARKMADIFDEDGSRHVTFPEMINVMNKSKATGSEPMLGSGITLPQLLIANKRRDMLEGILKMHKKHNSLNNSMTEKKFSNSFGQKRPVSSEAVLEARKTKMQDMQVNMENIEAEDYLRQRQQFDEKSRNPFTCQYCYKEFDYTHILEAHVLERHEYKNKYFTCYQCSETWIPTAERGSHMMKHKTGASEQKNKTNIVQNAQDSANFKSQSVLDRFKCQYCKLVFPSRQVLAFHHSQEHRPLSLDIFRCTYCDDSFDTYEKVLKHKKEFHTNKIHGFKDKTGSRSGVGQGFMDAIAQLDDYDSDNDMSPEEYQEISKQFHASESRRMLRQRVNHLGHILDFRATYNMPDRTVDKLKTVFDKQDEIKRTQNLLHVTSLLTSKFTEVVTEDEDQTFTETITDDRNIYA